MTDSRFPFDTVTPLSEAPPTVADTLRVQANDYLAAARTVRRERCACKWDTEPPTWTS